MAMGAKQRWREWSSDNSEQSGSSAQSNRDPKIDPRPGDILHHPKDQFPRKVVKRQR
jgi:hypothetical protein